MNSHSKWYMILAWLAIVSPMVATGTVVTLPLVGGGNATASGTDSIALGPEASATAGAAVALGGGAADGWGSMAFSGCALAEGDGSFAFGYMAEADGPSSFAFGDAGVSIGWYSFAVGGWASGNYSVALGEAAIATGSFSTAMGETTAKAVGGTSIGLWNLGKTKTGATPSATVASQDDPIFEVGAGADYSHPANALTVYRDGTVRLMKAQGGISMGQFQ